LEAPAHLEAVHIRHHHVEQHDIDVLAGADGERLGAGCGRQDLEIFRRESGFEQPDIGWNIIDDQNACCHTTPPGLREAAGIDRSAPRPVRQSKCNGQSFPESETPRWAWRYIPRTPPAGYAPCRLSWQRR